MLERLLIKNFQCHERLEIKLDPLVTTLVGPSDVGKSAVLRVLRLLCLNQPGGTSYIRHGRTGDSRRRGGRVPEAVRQTCRLLLEFDGTTAKRVRGNGVNLYGLAGASYRSFGTGVPADIRDRLNVSDLNFAGQLEPPFWFCDPPGKVQRELNAIVDLGVIDTALSRAAAGERKAKTAVEVCEERLGETEGELKTLAWVPAYGEAVARLEAKHELYRVAAARHADLAVLWQTLINARKTQQRADQARQRLTALVALGERAVRAGQKAQALRQLLASIRTATTVASQSVPDLTRLEQIKSRWQKVMSKWNALTDLTLAIQEARRRWQQYDTDLAQTSKQLRKMMGGLCPYCRSPIKSSP